MIKLKLSIPQPCHEDWAKMSPTEKGRHCAVCDKEVLDMRGKSPEEVALKISHSKSGEVCAQIPNHILDKPIQLHAASIGKYGKMGAAGALITAVALSPTISDSANLFETISDNNITAMNQSAIHVNGTIVGDKDEIISGAKISIKQNEHQAITYSLANGRFVMNLDPQKIKNGKAILLIEKPGYTILEREIDIDGNMQNGKFILEGMKMEMVEMQGQYLERNIILNEVTGGKVMMTDEFIRDEQQQYVTVKDCYRVTGGAVVYTNYTENYAVYSLNTLDTLMQNEKMTEDVSEIKIINSLKTYPNPTTDYVNLEMVKEGNYTVFVFALDGKMILTENFNSNKLQVNLSAFERGNYIVKVVDNDTQEAFDGKVVLMR